MRELSLYQLYQIFMKRKNYAIVFGLLGFFAVLVPYKSLPQRYEYQQIIHLGGYLPVEYTHQNKSKWLGNWGTIFTPMYIANALTSVLNPYFIRKHFPELGRVFVQDYNFQEVKLYSYGSIKQYKKYQRAFSDILSYIQTFELSSMDNFRIMGALDLEKSHQHLKLLESVFKTASTQSEKAKLRNNIRVEKKHIQWITQLLHKMQLSEFLGTMISKPVGFSLFSILILALVVGLIASFTATLIREAW